MKKVWAEDDATYGTDGHVNYRAKYRELTGQEFSGFDVVWEKDQGDQDCYVMNTGYVVYSSYPGNSEIWQL